MNRDKRLIYIMEAVEEISAAKKAEGLFIRDFRKANPRKEGYSPKAPRRQRKVVARDVLVWLQGKKLGNFCLNTIKEDLLFLKKNSTYTIWSQNADPFRDWAFKVDRGKISWLKKQEASQLYYALVSIER